jgi:hypothetical protein
MENCTCHIEKSAVPGAVATGFFRAGHEGPEEKKRDGREIVNCITFVVVCGTFPN